MADDEELRRLIEHYFNLGYQSKVIIEFLKKHDISISLATLKRRLQDYGLSRRGQAIDDQQLREVIRCEISGPGELMGYRAVWHSLRINHNIHVPRQRIATILRELDPDATCRRRSRRLSRRRYISFGPNFCWHVDGKCKNYLVKFPSCKSVLCPFSSFL